MNDMKTAVDLALNAVTWKAIDPPPEPSPAGIPRVTHEGVLEIMGHRFRAYQLDDGQRVFDVDDLEAFLLGRQEEAERAEYARLRAKFEPGGES